jgi:uncharacterized protein (DUF58 family)
MYILFGILTAILVVLGFVGIVAGVYAFIFWGAALLCAIAFWKLLPKRKIQEGKEPRNTINKMT